jgi:Tfp pilus assembly protein PilF
VAGSFLAYQTLRQQKFYENDEVFYQRGIDVAPTNALVIDLLGETYLRKGEGTRSMDLFRRAYQLESNNPSTTFYLARGLFETHQYEEAETFLTKASQSSALVPRRKQILLALANTKMNLNKAPEAMQTLRQLEQIDPAYRGLHRTLGILFQRQGKIAEAQTEYLKEFRFAGDLEAGQQAAALARFTSSNPSR